MLFDAKEPATLLRPSLPSLLQPWPVPQDMATPPQQQQHHHERQQQQEATSGGVPVAPGMNVAPEVPAATTAATHALPRTPPSSVPMPAVPPFLPFQRASPPPAIYGGAARGLVNTHRYLQPTSALHATDGVPGRRATDADLDIHRSLARANNGEASPVPPTLQHAAFPGPGRVPPAHPAAHGETATSSPQDVSRAEFASRSPMEEESEELGGRLSLPQHPSRTQSAAGRYVQQLGTPNEGTGDGNELEETEQPDAEPGGGDGGQGRATRKRPLNGISRTTE